MGIETLRSSDYKDTVSVKTPGRVTTHQGLTIQPTSYADGKPVLRRKCITLPLVTRCLPDRREGGHRLDRQSGFVLHLRQVGTDGNSFTSKGGSERSKGWLRPLEKLMWDSVCDWTSLLVTVVHRVRTTVVSPLREVWNKEQTTSGGEVRLFPLNYLGSGSSLTTTTGDTAGTPLPCPSSRRLESRHIPSRDFREDGLT